MKTKHRAVIVLVVLTVFSVPALCLMVFSALNIIVAKDPKITDRPYKAEYETSGAIKVEGGKLNVETRKGASGWELAVNPGGQTSALDDDGKVKGTGAYTPFWIMMKNPVINSVQLATRNYEAPIIDPTGILGGAPGEKYTIRMEKPFIFWSPNLQSQASYRMGIYDAVGVETATAVIDATCGFLFQLETHVAGAGRLNLLSTDFPISRNRYLMAEVAAIIALILAVVFLFRYYRSPEALRVLRRWDVKFALWGIVACYVDIYADVWWPFAFGTWGLLALHAVALIPGAIWFGWWILPGIIEVLWAANFALQTESLIPQLTHCPGLILSWMMATMFYRIHRPATE